MPLPPRFSRPIIRRHAMASGVARRLGGVDVSRQHFGYRHGCRHYLKLRR